MREHNDNTAEQAIGNVNREWKEMAALALRVRSGRCKPSWAEEQEAKFTGIFSRLLTDPIEKVYKETGRK